MSEQMSQAEIDAMIASMMSGERTGEPAPADTGAAVEMPHPAKGDDPVSASADPGRLDLGPILQSEVDALVEVRRQSSSPAMAPLSITPPGLPGPALRSEPDPLSLLMEINLTLTVVLGRTRMLLKQVLGMGPGTVIALENHPASAPVTVLINATPVMKAEVVVIGENYGIRVTESRLSGRKAS